MKRFAHLFQQLDQTTKTNAKVEALSQYFQEAPEQDRLWTIALLSHKRPRRTVNTSLLRSWAAEMSKLPDWLFDESYHIVGDLAESIALMLPKPVKLSELTLSAWILMILELKDVDDEIKKARIMDAWQSLNHHERFVFNKLITGGFRIGVSQKLMTRALSKATKIEEAILAHRLMGDWSPIETTFEKLVLQPNPLENISKPYPFYLAYALDISFEELGDPIGWTIERKWDGIRGQIIVRKGQVFVWSRGEELLTDRFPEFADLKDRLPNGTVIDGEILPFKDGKHLSFQALQTRIGRKKLSRKVLSDAPVIMTVFDLLEYNGDDIRQMPFIDRRHLLEKLIANNDVRESLLISEIISFTKWEQLIPIRAQSRELDCEGLMLKRNASTYRTGRRRGDWWKWKIDPLTIDAVMIYAQQGHGRRANLFTDYTFAVWKGDALVPFAKAYSGLTDAEFKEITTFVRKNTLERFGPVRAVQPNLVFEIAFEGIQASKRHKSGIALRFPRIHRWRKDKHPKEANTLDNLMDLLEKYG
jgi:DNA ligase-1